MEAPEQYVKCIQRQQKWHQNDVIDTVLVSLLLTLNKITHFTSFLIFDIEQVNIDWERYIKLYVQ